MFVGPWAYYSPLWLGALLVLALNDALRASLPPMAPWARWLIVVGAAVLVGLQSQVLMIGAQGAFSQVLPVPRGRSIRGGAAAAGGWLLIAWVVLSAVTVLLAWEGVALGDWVMGVLSLAALGGAIGIYIWNLPTAVTDFKAERR
jgi:hypothetical protein